MPDTIPQSSYIQSIGSYNISVHESLNKMVSQKVPDPQIDPFEQAL